MTDTTVTVIDDGGTLSLTESDRAEVITGNDLVEIVTEGIQGPVGPQGTDGASAYELAVTNGFVGTVGEWIASVETGRAALAARAYLATADISTVAGWQKIPVDVVSFDTDGIWDATNKRFTPTRAGYYQCNLRFRITEAAEIVAGLARNGVVVAATSDHAVTGFAAAGSSLIYCNGTTDYLELWGHTGLERTIASASLDTFVELFGPVTAAQDGASAYEIAVVNGFVGTEAQWLASLMGLQGPQGPQGSQGPQGDPGPTGIQGPAGETGPQGATGPVGAQGAQGPAGATGPQGIPGEIGPQGIQGPSGESAYEAAVANGFVGTEAAWLVSLVGPAGPQGVQGIAGATGATGPAGADGDSAYELAVTNGFVGTEAQWLASLVGPQGSQGIQGIQGEAGPAGTTSWVGITDKPAEFTPAAHAHAVADVTGLQTALDGKEPAISKLAGYAKWTGAAWSFVDESYAASGHNHAGTYEPVVAAGTIAQYWRGDKTWRDFFTDVRAATLTGLSTVTSAVIDATDTVLSALGKLQKQITDNLTTLTNHTGNTSNPHSVTAAQVGADPSGTASTAVSSHAAAADPHAQYVLESAIGTAAAKNAPAAGDASTLEVVLGNDTRLTDARTPTTHAHAVADVTGLQGSLDAKSPLASPTFSGELGLYNGAQQSLVAVAGNGPFNYSGFVLWDDTYSKYWMFTHRSGGGGDANDFKIEHYNGVTYTTPLQITTGGDLKSNGNAVWHAGNFDPTSKQATLVSGTNIKTINGQPVTGAGDLVVSGGETITVVAYDDRANLRSMTPEAGDKALVDGLGLFVYYVGSDEPDDDESCFATAAGRWLIEAVHWDVVDAWQAPEKEIIDDHIADGEANYVAAFNAEFPAAFDARLDTQFPTDFAAAFGARALFATGACAITSIAATAQASFTVTVTGAAVGDRVIANPPDALSARLSTFARVTAADTVTIYLNNPSAASTTIATGTWAVAVLKEA